jgi:hypothetical protein
LKEILLVELTKKVREWWRLIIKKEEAQSKYKESRITVSTQ